eukprot:5109-Alexandrium_andersonii.AAC.1
MKAAASPAPCAAAVASSGHSYDEEESSTVGPDSDQDPLSEDETADEFAPLSVPPWVEWDREAC